GDQLLARAAFAQNQHAHVLCCDPADGLRHFLHHGTAANNSVFLVVGGQDGWYSHQSAGFDGTFDNGAETIEADRLHEVIKSTVHHRFDRCFGGTVSRNEDYGLSQVELADLLITLQALTIRELQVQHNDVRIVLS